MLRANMDRAERVVRLSLWGMGLLALILASGVFLGWPANGAPLGISMAIFLLLLLMDRRMAWISRRLKPLQPSELSS